MRGLGLRLAVAAVLAWTGHAWAEEVSDDDPLVRSAHQAIAGALNTQLEHARSNQPVPWGDPVSNLRGTITVFPPAMQAGKPCRSFKYVVRDSQDEVIDRGLYCRDPIGLWRMAGVPDLLDKHQIASADTVPPLPDPAVSRLQRNLARLAYSGSPDDGREEVGFATALSQFEADEGMRQGSDPDAMRHALALSTATLARSDVGGVCAPPEGEEATTLACGRRR